MPELQFCMKSRLRSNANANANADVQPQFKPAQGKIGAEGRHGKRGLRGPPGPPGLPTLYLWKNTAEEWAAFQVQSMSSHLKSPSF